MPTFEVTHDDGRRELVEADRVDVEAETWVVLRRSVTVIGRPREVVVRRIAALGVLSVEQVLA